MNISTPTQCPSSGPGPGPWGWLRAVYAWISVNTSTLAAEQRQDYKLALSEKYQLPCVDPLIDGTDLIIDAIQQRYPVWIYENQMPWKTVSLC